MDDIIKEVQKEIAEIKLELKEIREEIHKIKTGSIGNGVYLDGCTDSVKDYINKEKGEN